MKWSIDECGRLVIGVTKQEQRPSGPPGDVANRARA